MNPVHHEPDACQFCEAPALLGFGRQRGNERLTLLYWTCRRCERNNVSAWDWERRDLAPSEVMPRLGEGRVSYAAAEFLRRQARRKEAR